MNLKQKLDYHYRTFDKSKISPDPLQFLHLYKNEKNIEAIGFLASVFAYGNVKQIIRTLERIVFIMGKQPHKYQVNFSSKDYKDVKGLKHRFYTENDILILFLALQHVYKNHGSLKNLFLTFYNSSEPNLKHTISKFSNHLMEIFKEINGQKKVSSGLKFMFPNPAKGSACKRMNLFLRWMIRKDELDFGLWNEIPTNKLIIPVDTHIARICKSLKLTKKKNVNWKMAEEITENLKKYDPIDPVKYDFALCHIGMRKLKF
ncbi:MAG: TIGR02757 family protein [Ignavibacteriaceae bacterium]|nr:TIGR02757 family protein [Ignavibacteriaceae bacterium]